MVSGVTPTTSSLAGGLLITGHPRSGTTLLKNLCAAHPELFVTSEFSVFLALGRPFPVYWKRLRKNWYERPLLSGPNRWNFVQRLRSGLFFYRFVAAVRSSAKPRVELAHVIQSLHQLAPHATLVGDKTPGYVFRLSDFADHPELKCVVIYRDPRDVAASAYRKATTDWKDRSFAQDYLDPAKTARSWLRAMNELERNLALCLAIRYEDLVGQPEEAIRRLGDYLGVEQAAFDISSIKPNRVGKHARRLSSQAVQQIESTAGEMMARYGYG